MDFNAVFTGLLLESVEQMKDDIEEMEKEENPENT
jgi:hypothetical protein